MRRREFIAGLGGATAVWPLAAHAQQGKRLPVIAMVYSIGAVPEHASFRTRLARFGLDRWTYGHDRAAIERGPAPAGWGHPRRGGRTQARRHPVGRRSLAARG